MTKYEPLAEFLGSHKGDSCTLALAEIERIIAKPLPRSARTHPAWWGNDGTHSQARAWMEAGWRARPASPDLDSVIFERKGHTHLRTTLSGPDGAHRAGGGARPGPRGRADSEETGAWTRAAPSKRSFA